MHINTSYSAYVFLTQHIVSPLDYPRISLTHPIVLSRHICIVLVLFKTDYRVDYIYVWSYLRPRLLCVLALWSYFAQSIRILGNQCPHSPHFTVSPAHQLYLLSSFRCFTGSPAEMTLVLFKQRYKISAKKYPPFLVGL